MAKKEHGAMSENPAGLAKAPYCQTCQHFTGLHPQLKTVRCKAYPFGIEDDQFNGKVKHTQVNDDQEGDFTYVIKPVYAD